jgi:hypothetical protein
LLAAASGNKQEKKVFAQLLHLAPKGRKICPVACHVAASGNKNEKKDLSSYCF